MTNTNVRATRTNVRATRTSFLPPSPQLSRRAMLQRSAVGFGSLAMASLLSDESAGVGLTDHAHVPHHAPRAKRVIFLFMKGGPSHLDTFDYKPKLQKDAGKELPFAKPRVQFAKTGNLLASPWKFRKYGSSGIEISDLFPHVAQCADDLCILNSVHGTNAAHGGALLKLHTGSDTFIRPSMGAWVNYGLGTENHNLPGFVTICPTLAHGGVKNWSSAFLPAQFQGVPLGVASQPSSKATVKYIRNPRYGRDLQRIQLDLLSDLNQTHLVQTGPNAMLEARIKSLELAFRMQVEMPESQDLTQETAHTRRLYGMDRSEERRVGKECRSRWSPYH